MGHARRRRDSTRIEIELQLEIHRIHHDPCQGNKRIGLEGQGE
jgi:hypothetical protein